MNIVMIMLTLVLVVPLLQAQIRSPTGDAAAGKKAWDARRCLDCHGEHGEGGYGPDLAAREITNEHFKYQVRKPFAFMPAFTSDQISDEDLANVRAYLVSLPPVEKSAPWRVAVPPNVPRGQFLIVAYGCAQCHDQELRNPREALGGVASDVNFEYFSKFVYAHTDIYSTGRMGTFTKVQIPESILQEIYTFATRDLGLIPTVVSAVGAPVYDGANTIYKVYVTNRGVEGKGLTAEDLTVRVALKAGFSLINVTPDTQGVLDEPEIKSNVAVWKIAELLPGERKIYNLTVAGKMGKAPDVFAKGSLVRWAKPVMRPGIANLDTRS